MFYRADHDLINSDPMNPAYRYRWVVGFGLALLLPFLAFFLGKEPSSPPPPVDVSLVSTISSTAPISVRDPFEFQVTAANLNGTSTVEARIDAKFPSGAQLVAAKDGSGRACQITPLQADRFSIRCSVYLIGSRSSVVTVTVMAPEKAGTYEIVSDVALNSRTSVGVDPDLSNNVTTITFAVREPQG